MTAVVTTAAVVMGSGSVVLRVGAAAMPVLATGGTTSMRMIRLETATAVAILWHDGRCSRLRGEVSAVAAGAAYVLTLAPRRKDV